MREFLQQTRKSGSKKIRISLILMIWAFMIPLFNAGVQAQNCSVNAGIPQTVCVNEQLFLQGSYTPPLQSGAQVVWSQIGGPAATIVDPAVLNTEVTNLIAGNSYTFRITTTCADGALTYQDVTHTVTSITPADAGPDATYCPGASASLAGNAPGPNETGLWTGSGGGVTVNNPTNPTSALTISGGSSGSVTLRWTFLNSLSHCISYDEVIITNRGGITPVSAGSDQILSHCYSSTQSVILNGSYAGSGIDGQQGTWSVVSGPNVPAIVSPNALNTSVTGLIQGTYVFRWTVVGPCASGSDEVQVTVPAPTANVTGASITGGNQVFCDPSITSTVLTGSIPQYVNETVQWVQTGGPALPGGSIVSPNSPVTTVNNLANPNAYTFSYTINNPVTVCSSSASVTVSYLSDPPTLAITTPSPLLLACDISSAIIEFTAGGSGITQYRFLDGPESCGWTFPTTWINSGSSPLTVAGITGCGTFLLQMRRVTTLGGDCSTPFAEISIVTSCGVVAANAGTDQIVDCDVTTTTLVGNDPTLLGGFDEGTWSQVSGPSAIILSAPHSPTLSIGGLLPNGLYVFRWMISGGPTCPTSQDDVQILTANILPSAYSAGPNQTNVCYNTPVYLAATPPAFVFERGTWTVDPGAGVIISDIHLATAIVTGLLPYTTYTFTWTVANGCGSESSSMTVDVINTPGPIVADAGTNQCLGTGTTTINLTGNNPSPGTGLWSFVSGPNTPTITPPATSPTTTVTGLIDGTYKFEWAIYSGGCNPTRDTVVITIADALETFDAGVDQQICGTTATVTSSHGGEPIIGTGLWTLVSGNAATITTPTNYTTTITGLISGVYVFRYTVTNGACIASDDVSLFVSEPAPEVADGGTTPKGVCELTSVLMDAVPPSAGSGIWTIISGPNTPDIVTPGSPTTNITGLITGDYVFRWTVSGGAFCPSTSSDVTVNVTLQANAGNDQSYCEAITEVNLTGTLASVGTWTQIGTTPNVATITTTSGNTAIASGLIPGVYTFRYTIAAPGCESIDEMTVTLYSPPSTAAAGADQTLCNNTTFTMDATDPPSGTGTWSKLSGPAGGSFTDANLYNTTFTSAVPGVYVFQWTVANFTCSNADQVRITNYAEPSAAVAGSDKDLTCETSVTMTATDPAIGLGTWTFLSKTGDSPTPVITNPLLYNSTITGLGPKTSGDSATYTFLWTVSNGICTSNTDEVKIFVYQTPTLADAGPDQSLCNQTSALLAATPVTVGTGTWTQISPAVTTESFSDVNSPTATINDIIPGTIYVLRWTSATAFCSSFDEVTINNYTTPTTADVSGTITSYCTLVPIALVGNTPTVGTGTWTQISGSALTILSPNSPSTSAIGGTTGNSYGFRWTISNGTCPTNSADVTVTMYSLPSQALAGPDQVLCYPTTSTTLDGNTPTLPSTGLWSVFSGPNTPSFSLITDPNAIVSGLIPGTYILVWSHVNGSCSTSDDMQITVYGATTTADAGPDQTLCNATLFTMAANSPGAGETGTWVRISGPNNPSITTPSSPTTTITGTVPGTYIFRWRIASGTCPYTEDFVTITNRTAITLTGPANSSICKDGTQTLSVSASGGSGLYDFQWQYFNVSWTDVGTNSNSYTTPALSPAGPYLYRVVVTDQVPGNDGGCSTTGNATVTVVDDPSWVTNNVTPVSICEGGQVTFSASVTGGLGGTISWIRSTISGGSGITVTSPDSPPAAGTYYYRPHYEPTGIGCDLADGVETIVTVVADPVIVTQPLGSTICSGTTHIMTVEVSGGTGNYSYEWQVSVNGSTGWTAVQNDNNTPSTTSTYTTASLTVTRYYRVLITQAGNGCNTLTSNTVAVYVPRITTQPIATDAAICVGGTSLLTVVTEVGVPAIGYTYQWQYDSDPTAGTNWNNVVDATPAGATYTNATTASMTVSGIGLAGAHDYRVVIQVTSPVVCTDLTSNTVTVNVAEDPAITSQPTSPADICTGGTTANMTIVATGGTPSLVYQWQYYNGSTWNNVSNGTPAGSTYSGATGTTFSVAGISIPGSYQYQCLVTATGNDCNPVTSNTVIVTVVADPTLTNPVFTNNTICAGGTTIVSSTISGGTGTPTYQWQYFNGSSWNNVVNGTPAGTTYTNATTLTMTISGATGAGVRQYRLTTNNSSGCDFNSNGASYTIVADPNITTQPISPASICVGGTTTTINIVVAGGTPSLVYQWQYNNGGTWESVTNGIPAGSVYTGGTGTAFSVASISIAGSYQYRCYITAAGDGCGTATSNTITVTVAADPAITSQPTSPADICSGGTAAMTITASGGTPVLLYQWQYFNGSSWNNVSNGTPAGSTYTGGTGTNFSVAGITAAGSYQYQCLVSATGNDCNTVTSNTVIVTVVSDPTLTDPVFTNNTICAGGTTIVSSTISGGTGTPTYQWQYYNGATWNNVANGTPAGTTYTNATTLVMTISGATGAGVRQYRLTTNNSLGCNFNSTGVSYTVVADPNITTQPASPAAICVGGTTTTINIVAAGGTPSLVYQWQYNNGGTWESVTNGIPAGSVYTGGTGTAFSVAGFTVAGSYQYRCYITASGDGCGTATSNTITITVAADPAITSQPTSPADICSGGTAAMTIIASGGTPVLLYQWQYFNGSSWNNVSNGTPAGSVYTGGTGTNFSVTGITAAGSYQYQCLVSATGNDCNTVTSNTVTIIVVADPLITVPVFTNNTICAGGTTIVSSTISGGTGIPNYQWQYFNGSSWNSVVNGTPAGTTYTNATTLTMTISGATGPGSYQYRLTTNNSAGCDVNSNGASYTVVADPNITTQPASPASICVGGTTTTINIVAAGGTPLLVYQWQYNNGGTWESVTDGIPAGSVYTGGTGTAFSAAGFTLQAAINTDAILLLRVMVVEQQHRTR